MLEWKTLHDIREGYKNKIYKPSEVVGYYLDRIEKRNPEINAFISIFSERALREARMADERIEKKQGRVLEGIPVALKDNILVAGEKATAGSNILQTYTAAYSATVVKKLQDAGAIILGKTNLDEFAMGGSTEFSAFGPTKNPHDITKVPGGSSGGSAAAVSDDMCAVSFGSDTGGSIRQPASFCGVVGFKPTYGRVSRYGLIAMASSLDQIGPFSRSVQDAYELFALIAGNDPYDATTVEAPVAPLGEIPTDFLKGKTIGYATSFLESGLDEEVKKVFVQNLDALKTAGATIIEIDIPKIQLSLPVYYLIVTSEVSSNLARFDGVRYGTRSKADELIEQYIATRTDGFGDEAKRRIMLGAFTLSAGYRDKYYKQALKVKDRIRTELLTAFASIDVLVSPTSPTAAFDLGAKLEDPLTMYLSDLFTVPANIGGLPAISIPSGMVRSLPAGFQFMGKPMDDTAVLQFASAAEKIFGLPTAPSR